MAYPTKVVPTPRAAAAGIRSYHRPVDPHDPESKLESWEQVIDRVISHQRWLWERALQHVNAELQPKHEEELEELRTLLVSRRATVAGRTMWLGGTDVAKKRES